MIIVIDIILAFISIIIWTIVICLKFNITINHQGKFFSIKIVTSQKSHKNKVI